MSVHVALQRALTYWNHAQYANTAKHTKYRGKKREKSENNNSR